MLRLFTFGGLQIDQDGQPIQLPTQRTRELLAYLVTFRDRAHPRPVLGDTLWPDIPEERTRRHLSDTLWQRGASLVQHRATLLAGRRGIRAGPACRRKSE